jgi:O-antigen/teichoic acid export membrane protein
LIVRREIDDRRMARNAVWTLLSLGAPMLIALAAIPALIRTLGADRFGIVTLSWLLIGYCSLFDLGLGRALTRVVSEKFSGGPGDRDSSLPGTVWTALVMMALLGCAGGALFAAASGWLAHSVLKVPPALQSETGIALRWIAAAIPLVTLSAGLRGVLEARQRFGSLGIVRAIMGVLTFTGPLVAARLQGGLPGVVFTLTALRLVTLLAHAFLCYALTPELFSDRTIRARTVGPLFRFGGWLTISGLISPLMVSMDRFLIGIFLSMTSVAYYATPFEIVTKLKVIPAAIATVLFPALSSSLSTDPARARRLFSGSLYAVLGVLTPLTILVVVFARPGLRLWLGEDFAAHGYRPLQLLAIGVLINSAADVAVSLLHASGRPDVNAKLHMLEFVLYVPLVCWMIRAYGIDGAALAWVLRVTFDAALLFWMAGRSMPAPERAFPDLAAIPESCR